MEQQIRNTVVRLVKGDLTEMETQAIVNAANSQLQHGGGVAGAIRRKGGDVIQQESNEWVKKQGNIDTGKAAITSGGNLNANYVIHAVGPVMGDGEEGDKIAAAVTSSLQLADEYQLESIAFPAISTGIFGVPLETCAAATFKAIRSYPKEQKTNLNEIIICLYDDNAFSVFSDNLNLIT